MSEYTVKDWMKALEYAKEHYTVSDELMREGYRQTSMGRKSYLGYAKNDIQHAFDKITPWNKLCDPSEQNAKPEHPEPSQRWHFFDAYLCVSLMNGTFCLSSSAKKQYNKLSCPELLLWISEASGVDECTVREAKKKAIQGIKNKISAKECGKNIRDILKWDLVSEKYGELIEKNERLDA